MGAVKSRLCARILSLRAVRRIGVLARTGLWLVAAVGHCGVDDRQLITGGRMTGDAVDTGTPPVGGDAADTSAPPVGGDAADTSAPPIGPDASFMAPDSPYEVSCLLGLDASCQSTEATAEAATSSPSDASVSPDREESSAVEGGDVASPNDARESDACPGAIALKAIDAGMGHTCVLTMAGGVRCWGYNPNGMLGDGTTSARTTPPTADVLTGVQAIATGGYHTCALMMSGGVKCWGYGFSGQLGNGGSVDRLIPTDVMTAAGPLVGVAAISTGLQHTCALMSSGGVRCWGLNDNGQVGDGTATNRFAAPSSDMFTGVRAIAAGGFHTCALTSLGVQCWGANNLGQLGDGTTTNRSTPVTVTTSAGPLTGVRAIATGDTHSCALMTTDAVRCWGANDVGQGGDGTNTNRSTAPDADGPGPFMSLAAGGYYTCALTPAGGVRCWGDGRQGQLGDGTVSVRTTAQASDVLSGVQALAAGSAHTCALTTTSIRCWGLNTYGQLGDGTTVDRSTPTSEIFLCP